MDGLVRLLSPFAQPPHEQFNPALVRSSKALREREMASQILVRVVASVHLVFIRTTAHCSRGLLCHSSNR